ncbi:MAG: sugar phosphate nucleotidyltransferase [Eubacteriales bacterium]|jgi:glucose-1-phosphate thymidylyltransferase|nr:sugar phosphate nucleotidyltransferase [Eubacteriales bacterium]
MICIVLAAGCAARLYPLTEYFPNPLMNIHEETILDWLMDDIYNARVERYVVVSNHKFIEHFNQWAASKKLSVPITVIDTDTRFAAEELKLDDELLVIADDNVLNLSLTKFIEYAKSSGIEEGCDFIAWLCKSQTEGTRALF